MSEPVPGGRELAAIDDLAVEDSPEGFVARWRAHAAEAELFARPEGVPLIECEVAGAVIQVFERTGPYLSRPGKARLIVNPNATDVAVADPAEPVGLESLGLSRLKATGRVVEREGDVIVVQAGAPLVVTALAPLPPEAVPGAHVTFEAEAPVHGFVVPADRAASPRRDAVDEAI